MLSFSGVPSPGRPKASAHHRRRAIPLLLGLLSALRTSRAQYQRREPGLLSSHNLNLMETHRIIGKDDGLCSTSSPFI